MSDLINTDNIDMDSEKKDYLNMGDSENVDIVFKKESQFKEVWYRFAKNKSAVAGLVILTLFIFIAIFADVISPYDKGIKQNVYVRLMGPCLEYPFGTDSFGRDMFTRCIHATRISLSIGFVTTACSLLAGGILGAIAGFYGGFRDSVIMRLLDVISSMPSILLSLTIVAVLGTDIKNLMLAIMVSRTPAMARVVRSAVMTVVDTEYIEAAKAGGTKDVRIIIRHIIPNSIGPIMVQATMSVASMILQAASLSFLGLGIAPPTPEWGALVSSAREYLRTDTYLLLFPGAFIVLAALSLNLIGDGLRDAMDPRLKN